MNQLVNGMFVSRAILREVVALSRAFNVGSPASIRAALEFLARFGHVDDETAASGEVASIDAVSAAVKSFQRFYGLKQDGVIGPKTLHAMTQPRCGLPDVARAYQPQQLAVIQFARANANRWRKTSLRYAITSYVAGIPKPDQTRILMKAWTSWSAVCGIKTQLVGSAGEADILISTGAGRRDMFDGAGGTLAWAYLPTGPAFEGRLHMKFDLGETWIDSPTKRGILLLNVAAHEFGHLLGLDHSARQGALMSPYYNARIEAPQANDDVPRVQALYGRPKR